MVLQPLIAFADQQQIHRVEVRLLLLGAQEMLKRLLVRATRRRRKNRRHDFALIPRHIGQAERKISEQMPVGRILRIQIDRALHVFLYGVQLLDALLDAIQLAFGVQQNGHPFVGGKVAVILGDSFRDQRESFANQIRLGGVFVFRQFVQGARLAPLDFGQRLVLGNHEGLALLVFIYLLLLAFACFQFVF